MYYEIGLDDSEAFGFFEISIGGNPCINKLKNRKKSSINKYILQNYFTNGCGEFGEDSQADKLDE